MSTTSADTRIVLSVRDSKMWDTDKVAQGSYRELARRKAERCSAPVEVWSAETKVAGKMIPSQLLCTVKP